MALGDLVPWKRSRNGLVGRQDRDPFVALHGEMNRLFDEFSRGFGLPAIGGNEAGFGWPNVEVREDLKSFKIEAELPGWDQKDIELITDNVLTIRGEKRSESSDDRRHYTERYYGSFERQIPLAAEIDRDKVKAAFKNCVLKVEIPKSQQAVERSRKIPIES